jgi:hypothetical protein
VKLYGLHVVDMVDISAPWAFDCQIKRGAFAKQLVAMAATDLRRFFFPHEKMS